MRKSQAFTIAAIIVVVTVLAVCATRSFIATAQPTLCWLSGWNYRIPIVIRDVSGTPLEDYQVRIVLNSSVVNFTRIRSDGGDIRFTSADGVTLLPYWVEKWDSVNQEAVIWVRVPYIPANGTATIYMYYGNPLATSESNGTATFIFFEDFEGVSLSGWYTVGTAAISLSTNWAYTGSKSIHLSYTLSDYTVYKYIGTNVTVPVAVDFAVYETNAYMKFSIRPDYSTSSGIGIFLRRDDQSVYTPQFDNEGVGTTNFGPTLTLNAPHTFSIIILEGKAYVKYDGVLYGPFAHNKAWFQYIVLRSMNYGHGAGYFDTIRVRRVTWPEPQVEFGKEEVPPGFVYLPSKSLYLEHEIAYSPTGAQYTFTFSATNTTTAGYETGVPDDWGWRVYAEPYQSGGVSYGNTASLIGEVNISLPYASVLVENVTLFVRTNSTGVSRQLWIRVLDSNGNVVAELTNASMGTGWVECVVPVNANINGQVTVWINATVVSSDTASEEIGVKDVRVYVKYVANPLVGVEMVPDVDNFNCTAKFYVELGSTEYLNASVILFKLIEFLKLNGTIYPVGATYVGNETIGTYTYMVYRIDQANYSQYLTINALIANSLKTFRTHANGYDTSIILVGEPLTVELPELGNVSILEMNESFLNVTTVTLKFMMPGDYTVCANLTQPSLWRLGYARKVITVKYGSFLVKPIDNDSKVVDYEDLVFQLVNATDGNVVKEVTGNTEFNLSYLWAGDYRLVVKIKDLVIGVKDFELNITTDGAVEEVAVAMKKLPPDYRGVSRVVACDYDKQLVSIENLDAKYPYGRMSILLNGTGAFTLYIDYRGDIPTAVSVAGNVTNLQYRWDGDYLVITGALGSVGEVNITDLYRLAVVAYDRLGNRMPSWFYIYVNGTKHGGSAYEAYAYPADYNVTLPPTVNGFPFYAYSDGWNNSARLVSLNGTDISLAAYYRVPTAASAEAKRVAAQTLWLERLARFFMPQQEETAHVVIAGVLKDYYGAGVPNRLVYVNVTYMKTGYTFMLNATTDASGYFATQAIPVFLGQEYEVKVWFPGDDVYAPSVSTRTLVVQAAPPPTPAPAPSNAPLALAALIAIVAIVAAAVIATKVLKHVVHAEFEKRRRFVKRRY